MIHRPETDEHDCVRAREQLSARMDGELSESEALEAHLARCAKCRAHERALATVARGFAALREPVPMPDLWARIERGARARRFVPALERVAAALVGFVGLGGTALLVERGAPAPEPGAHLLERLAPRPPGPDVLFAALPEYRLLRALPAQEESR